MRFEIPTALTTKTNIFWDVTLYGLEKFTDITGEHTVSIIRVLLLTCLAYSSTQKMQVKIPQTHW
jgi:DMSO/TMAO reductase YedYZ heme-binding membrane subunit